jgi:hypothetical protein
MTSFWHNLISFFPYPAAANSEDLTKFSSDYCSVLLQLLNSQFSNLSTSKSKSHCDWRSVSKSWCRAPSGAHDQIFITVWHLRSCSLWCALSLERRGLSFVYAAGSSQRSLSRVRVPWYSRPYFTVSDLRLPISSPLTIRRVTVEVFDPASTRGPFTSSDCALL